MSSTRINDTLARMYAGLLDSKDPDPSELDALIEAIRAREVIIYGAGRSGRMLKSLFDGLNVPVSAFVDRQHAKIGQIDGVDVQRPGWLSLKDGRPEPLVVLGAGTMQLTELIEADITRLAPSLERANGVFLVYLLHYQSCKAKAEHGEYPPLKHCISYHVKPYKCPIFCRHVEELAEAELAEADASGDCGCDSACDATPQSTVEAGSTFNDVGYMLGEVCTLKCEHCHEGVPYLGSTERLPKETVLRDIRKLTEASRFLHRLDLVGGEPFSHPQIADIVRELVTVPKIGYIGVFTSGTSVPDAALCEALRHDRIIVTVSDYGHDHNLTDRQKDKIHRTIDMLAAHEVNFVVYPDRYWVDLNGYDKGDVPEARLEEHFSNCFMAACHRIYDGTLYHCPYQAGGIKMEKFEKRDVVDIHAHDLAGLVSELDKFENTKVIDACRYCNLPKGPTEVTAGRQLDRRHKVIRIHAETS
ncbi:radical SAM protein [Nitrogeniibacter aestuarii]|uniref:radical SAM protein n=1 Tax=Nitrogeniibacter aestuarii TaxID=2815343 RepID=UPI001D125605|nr:radical SAM protein [Nitrogeniibacter aestuarii]